MLRELIRAWTRPPLPDGWDRLRLTACVDGVTATVRWQPRSNWHEWRVCDGNEYITSGMEYSERKAIADADRAMLDHAARKTLTLKWRHGASEEVSGLRARVWGSEVGGYGWSICDGRQARRRGEGGGNMGIAMAQAEAALRRLVAEES